jgi:hypothetical protein
MRSAGGEVPGSAWGGALAQPGSSRTAGNARRARVTRLAYRALPMRAKTATPGGDRVA